MGDCIFALKIINENMTKILKEEKLAVLAIYGSRDDFEKSKLLKAKFDCFALNADINKDKINSLDDIKDFVEEAELNIATTIGTFIRKDEKLFKEFNDYCESKGMRLFCGMFLFRKAFGGSVRKDKKN